MADGYDYGGRDTITYQQLHGYKNLVIWQKGSDLNTLIHDATMEFGAGYYRLSDQMRGAAISVTNNIAEGYCSGSLGNYIRHCLIARGSLGELGSQIQDSERWSLIGGNQLQQIVGLYADTSYLLDGLIKALRRKQQNGTWDNSFGVHEEQGVYNFDEYEGSVDVGN